VVRAGRSGWGSGGEAGQGVAVSACCIAKLITHVSDICQYKYQPGRCLASLAGVSFRGGRDGPQPWSGNCFWCMGSCRCAARGGRPKDGSLGAGGLGVAVARASSRHYVANATWLACIANHTVIPAKAGTHASWVPAYAGMTILCGVCHIMPLRPSWRLDGELATGLPIGVCAGHSVLRAAGDKASGKRRCTQMSANEREWDGGCRSDTARQDRPGPTPRKCRLLPDPLAVICVHVRHRFLAESRQPTEPPGGRAGARPTLHNAASRRRDGAAAGAAGARGAIGLHCR
jgi:hypothetical protein